MEFQFSPSLFGLVPLDDASSPSPPSFHQILRYKILWRRVRVKKEECAADVWNPILVSDFWYLSCRFCWVMHYCQHGRELLEQQLFMEGWLSTDTESFGNAWQNLLPDFYKNQRKGMFPAPHCWQILTHPVPAVTLGTRTYQCKLSGTAIWISNMNMCLFRKLRKVELGIF